MTSHTDHDPRTAAAPGTSATANSGAAGDPGAGHGATDAGDVAATGTGVAGDVAATGTGVAGDVAATGAGAAGSAATGTSAGGDVVATSTSVAGDVAANGAGVVGGAPASGAGTEGGVPDRSAASLPEPPAPKADVASIDDVEEAMRDVVDPELGINVVDLGLVYDIRVDEQNTAVLDMTLTSAACPLTDVIEDQARSALVGGPAGGIVGDIKINWVWMPPWGPEKITEDGREQLRALGFTV